MESLALWLDAFVVDDSVGSRHVPRGPANLIAPRRECSGLLRGTVSGSVRAEVRRDDLLETLVAEFWPTTSSLLRSGERVTGGCRQATAHAPS